MKGRCAICSIRFEYVRMGSATRRLCDECRSKRVSDARYNRKAALRAATQKEETRAARNVPMSADLTDENNQPVSAKTLILRWMRG